MHPVHFLPVSSSGVSWKRKSSFEDLAFENAGLAGDTSTAIAAKAPAPLTITVRRAIN
jgi:hypothetical protein